MSLETPVRPPASVSSAGPVRILVQASSTSWTGSPDSSVSVVEGVPACVRTIRALRGVLPQVPVTVIAPAFDAGGKLPALLRDHGCHDVRVHFSDDASPLRRMLAATRELTDDALVLRVNGMNMFVDPRTVREMLAALAAMDDRVDCYKLSDDYPAVLCVDFYRIGALRRALAELPVENEFHVHVKHHLGRHAYAVREHPRTMHYTPAEIAVFRRQFLELQQCEHAAIDERKVLPQGDQLKLHYELAAKNLPPGSRVLDIGCGSGFGAAYLHDLGHEVIAADLDESAVAQARARYGERAGLSFRVMNAEATGLPDNSLDAVTSFETIEHVGSIPAYLRELRRVVRPGGRIFLSTPQNCFGRHPLSCWHQVEFSAAEFRAIVAEVLEVEEFIGIKQGRIWFADDPIGNNSYLVARPRK